MARLIRLFLERCDDFAGVPVFYEVSKDNLHQYADFGLAFVKLGEEARGRSGGVHARRRPRRQIPPGDPAAREGRRDVQDHPGARTSRASSGRCARCSDDWLGRESRRRRKDSRWASSTPSTCRASVAVVERAGRIVAFANLWLDADRTQLSLDLMRFHRDAPGTSWRRSSCT